MATPEYMNDLRKSSRI